MFWNIMCPPKVVQVLFVSLSVDLIYYICSYIRSWWRYWCKFLVQINRLWICQLYVYCLLLRHSNHMPVCFHGHRLMPMGWNRVSHQPSYHYYKTNPHSLGQWIHCVPIKSHSLWPVNSLNIYGNHLAYRDTFCCSTFMGYLRTLPTLLPMGYLPTYLKVLIGHLTIYSKATYGLSTYPWVI
jgi:hypothetical protein